MDYKLILIAHTFIAGVCGIPAMLYISGFLLSTESVRSSKIGVRYLYRYLLFCFWYMVSFMTTPLILKLLPVNFLRFSGEADSYMYFLVCLPLALLLYCLEYKAIIWGDGPKLRVREKLRRRS